MPRSQAFGLGWRNEPFRLKNKQLHQAITRSQNCVEQRGRCPGLRAVSPSDWGERSLEVHIRSTNKEDAYTEILLDPTEVKQELLYSRPLTPDRILDRKSTHTRRGITR